VRPFHLSALGRWQTIFSDIPKMQLWVRHTAAFLEYLTEETGNLCTLARILTQQVRWPAKMYHNLVQERKTCADQENVRRLLAD